MPLSWRRTSTGRTASEWVVIHDAFPCNNLRLQIYERGTELFTFPISFEIWNIYLSKFVKRYVRRSSNCFRTNSILTFSQGGSKLERARDLFEQALEKCPPKACKPLFLMYGKLEEDYGLAKRAMSIYERAAQVVADEDKFEVCTFPIRVNNC